VGNTEPREDKGGGKDAGCFPEVDAAPCVHGDQNDEQEKDKGVCNIKEGLARKQERVEEKECDHTTAVYVIMPQEGLEYIGKCRNVYARMPDHRVVVVVAVQGHKGVECKHQGEDQECSQCGLYVISIHIRLLNA